MTVTPIVMEAGPDAYGWVPGGVGGFGVVAPFVVPFGTPTITPNIALLTGYRSLAIGVKATSATLGGTEVTIRVHDPRDLSTIVFRKFLSEFIDQDGYNQSGFGALSMRLDDLQNTHFLAVSFEFASNSGSCTVEHWDGCYCYAA